MRRRVLPDQRSRRSPLLPATRPTSLPHDGATGVMAGPAYAAFFSGTPRATATREPDATRVWSRRSLLNWPRANRAVLEAGEIFGEGSALSRYPIATDIVALSDVRCLLIRTPAPALDARPPGARGVQGAVRSRYAQRALRAHLRRVELFKDLDARGDRAARRRRRAGERSSPGASSSSRAPPPTRSISCAAAT